MNESRWNEIERRLASVELRTGTLDSILKAAYDRTMMLSLMDFPPPTTTVVPTYPAGSCYNRAVDVYWSGVPSISTSYQSSSETPTCGTSVWAGIAPGASGWASILDDYTEYATYDGVDTMLEHYTDQCSGTNPSFSRATGFTPPSSLSYSPLNYDHPVTLRWLLTYHNSVPAVHSDDSITWFDSSNTAISNGNYFLSGTSSVSTSSPTSGTTTYNYANWGATNCQIIESTKPSISFTVSRTSGVSTLGTLKGTFRITFLDFAVSGNGTSDTAWAVTQYTGLLNAFKGTVKTIGGDTDQCNLPSLATSTDDQWSVTYNNMVYKPFVYSGSIGQPLRIRNIGPGRWAKATPKVKRTTCDSAATVYQTLPTTLAYGRGSGSSLADARGFSADLPTRINASTEEATEMSFQAFDRTLGIPVGPLESMYTEDWWDQSQGVTAYQKSVGGGTYRTASCNIQIKWRIEGPI